MTDALAALADTIFPATDGLGSASELGAVDYVRATLDGPRGRGENRYAAAPFVQPAHAGHGWQWPETPAQGVDHLLTVLGDDDLPARIIELEAGRLGDDMARAAFALVCTLVLEGVLADPRHGGNADGAAWRWIGYAGGTR
ncbi:MAG: gluconate 2-dehydrogenase subunit 3 family protein [Pseudonocardia sp.]|uniref:gluconate 2-dehydrogenase subunit 3 family protein n=1 Tax=unclassified Pseudonocardia TaxID=2619320 RepID=UPI00086F515F|nr:MULTISPECIES: gluconate 2-dehydrogenase subunit 3 family protein [unclassified Pseudonocardia]MBN9110355.1 gluconate 2-dehydrogenase subunit 3 family protein [Pseudonocardia sp.]ODU28309.1 MAG: hypothetical protein ABS80_02660 [Pseudonocardia sp. SCN 72-51]ODV03861.1 MAG: hypothetical protein ABT15_21675 [Pseudonocardia sp. SCN 73-27]